MGILSFICRAVSFLLGLGLLALGIMTMPFGIVAVLISLIFFCLAFRREKKAFSVPTAATTAAGRGHASCIPAPNYHTATSTGGHSTAFSNTDNRQGSCDDPLQILWCINPSSIPVLLKLRSSSKVGRIGYAKIAPRMTGDPCA